MFSQTKQSSVHPGIQPSPVDIEEIIEEAIEEAEGPGSSSSKQSGARIRAFSGAWHPLGKEESRLPDMT